MNRYRTIVVDADGSEASRVAVHAAAGFASAAGSRLVLVCSYGHLRGNDVDAAADVLKREAHLVRGAASADETLAVAAQEARAWGATDVVSRAVPGTRVEALLAVVADAQADLVVITGRGPSSPITRLLGTLSDEIARRSHVTVLSVSPTSAHPVMPRRREPRRKSMTATRVRAFAPAHPQPDASSQTVS
ncbi:universal stress protein [Nocardia sp. BSTN01]|uniref:universal stress protein n=1 Tax=Nocardia sp. BSTN01 TaxID=2783665 RepID=UPI00188EDD20|nr:universal stress protein [Nocardia sp. BSTN01]MBF4998661.1 universal stress protein [Nocardia sp. BSTN01]